MFLQSVSIKHEIALIGLRDFTGLKESKAHKILSEAYRITSWAYCFVIHLCKFRSSLSELANSNIVSVAKVK